MTGVAEDRLLSVQAAARILGQSDYTVRRHIKEGAIPAKRLGPGSRSPLRIRSRDLARYCYPVNPTRREEKVN